MTRPAGLVSAVDDAEVARLVRRSDSPQVRIADGDLARTLGAEPLSRPSDDAESSVLELPLDLVEVTSDVGEFVACAHVVARPRWTRGGWWFGPVTVVMNAEFIGDWDVAPRGHPNDGRVEVVEANDLSWRDRLAVRRRLPHGSHVPHPGITVRPLREASWEFARGRVVSIDGAPPFPTRSLSITVVPDAAVILH